ncbi:MAG TPA: ABC transporter ATP-binding protein [Streptosporangiaceae bacterium]|nr:ABC transporter ATP-binding protein [Streptosporangiaceae bacterium]
MSAGPMAPADLAVAGLHKAFGRHPVLAGLDLEVAAGTLTAVLGPSGSGKTTLLRILAGFERPDRGSVIIGGVTVDDDRCHVPADRRRIGYVSQEGSLFPHLTVGANVGFGLPRGQRRGRRVGDLLDAVALTGLAGRYPHQLSGGQQQRVALARALAVTPRVVLLDEPFASLDANLRASVRADVLAILRDAAMTAILVTHDQQEALSSAGRVAVIRDGAIAQFATPRDLYDHPADADLARFVGDANLLDGQAEDGLVRTPLGTLTTRGDLRAAPGKPVTVLIRPEQLEIRPGADGPGARGQVIGTSFHGHDTLIRVRADSQAVPSPILVRAHGNPQLMPGSGVTLTVREPVCAWPCDDRTR